jgi:NhaP-type Na+/H+ or K+/H+ antiporter
MPDVLTSLALIPVVGIGAQWLAWRFGLPSILVLLGSGLLLGAGLDLLDPDQLFGQLLEPGITLSLGLILFEGGLSLTKEELKAGGRVLALLLTVGVAITLGLGTALGLATLGLSWQVAVVLGAIVVVTGPTVVGPLLASIRPKGRAGAILKGEGILVDPLGAVLATLVFQAAFSSAGGEAAAEIAWGLVRFAAVGLAVGLVGAWFGTTVLRRYLIPDGMLTAFGFALAILVVAGADELVDDTGLLAVTVMGIAIGWERRSEMHRLLEFNEAVRVLLIGCLFVVLGATVTREQLEDLRWQHLVFVAGLILVARPLAVFLSTIKSTLTLRERTFMAWMAPRGVVAASTASLFALRLQGENIADADELVPAVFITILVTIVVYGLTAPRLARRLGVSEPSPQGVFIIGANQLAVEVGRALMREGYAVLLSDPDPARAEAARTAGLTVSQASLLSDASFAQLDLDGIGKLVSLTSDTPRTVLATQRLLSVFGRRRLYQLPPDEGPDRLANELRLGRVLATGGRGYLQLAGLVEDGARVQVRPAPSDPHRGMQADHRHIPLFVIHPDHRLVPVTADHRMTTTSGDRVVTLALPV